MALDDHPVDRDLTMTLQMGDGGREWLIKDRTYSKRSPGRDFGSTCPAHHEERHHEFHQMHLHGHTFALAGGTRRGPRKDTMNMAPKSEQVVEFDAVNPASGSLTVATRITANSG